MNYKKALVSVALVPLLGASTFADGHMEGEMMMETTSITAKNASSANFLAEKNIIENQSGNIEMYNLDGDINRREMLKVMMNASQESVSETCTGVFSDLHSDDWGCKYAEAAVRAGFIAENDMFRPNDNVTQAEALKMVMQARGIQRDENSDWRAGYASKAMSEGVITSALNFDANAQRGMIFDIAAKTYPDFSEEEVMMNIVETAQATDSLSTLVTAVIAADLVDTLSSEGPFTVFAPNNDAFAALAQGTVESLLMEENKAALADILTYHVVPGAYAAADVTDGLELTSVQGQKLMFTLVDGKVIINGNSEVILADVATSNGTVHVIDRVLMPSDEDVMMKNIVETAQATDSLSTLVTAVIAADLVDALSGEGPFTVFAPNNDAFAALAQGTVESLLMEENKAALADILTYHVVPGAFAAADVTDGLVLTTLNGQELSFTLVGGKVMINGNSEVILADVTTSNGTVHVINSVLMPSE